MGKQLIGLFFFCLASTLLWGQNPGGFMIKGTIKGLENGANLYLTKDMGKDTVGHAQAKDGSFTFIGKVPQESEYYFIRMDSSVTQKAMTLLLVNSTIDVNGSMDEWPELVVRGSEPQDEYAALLKIYRKGQLIEDSVGKEVALLQNKEMQIYDEAQKNGDTSALQASADRANRIYERIKPVRDENYNKLKEFVENHPNSLYIADLIMRLEPVLQREGMKLAYDKLTPRAKNSYFGVKLREYLLNKKNEIQVGKPMANFKGITPEGKELMLKDVVKKGKYTLLDFWASWCKPCRVETPNIRKAYELYHKKGFNVISVTSDNNRDDWKKAIAKDTMPWYHVSQDKWMTISKMYNVVAIPATFLIDDKGKIIATEGLRGDELTAKLGQLLDNAN